MKKTLSDKYNTWLLGALMHRMNLVEAKIIIENIKRDEREFISDIEIEVWNKQKSNSMIEIEVVQDIIRTRAGEELAKDFEYKGKFPNAVDWKDEDTKNDLCECGHIKEEHIENTGDINIVFVCTGLKGYKKGCKCKKFKAKKKVLLFCDNPACFATHLAKKHIKKKGSGDYILTDVFKVKDNPKNFHKVAFGEKKGCGKEYGLIEHPSEWFDYANCGVDGHLCPACSGDGK